MRLMLNNALMLLFGLLGLAQMLAILTLALLIRGLTLNHWCISGRVHRNPSILWPPSIKSSSPDTSPVTRN